MEHQQTYYLFYSEAAEADGFAAREVIVEGMRIKFNYWGHQNHADFHMGTKPTINNCFDYSLPDKAENFELVGEISRMEFMRQRCGWIRSKNQANLAH